MLLNFLYNSLIHRSNQMLKLLSWNIQYGKGVDGLIDLKRIRDGILETADADIICLQEISRNEPQTSDSADQLQVLQD